MTERKSETKGHKSLFRFFEKEIEHLHHEGRHRTAQTYTQTLQSVRRFRSNRDLSFLQLTTHFTRRYETWLRDRGLCRNTTSFYMRVLRVVYNKAVRAHLTPDQKPFRTVYTGIDKTSKRAVSLSTLRSIKESEWPHQPHLAFARDMFLLSYYLRGIAPVDLAYLRPNNIQRGFLVYVRSKTGQRMSIRFMPQMQQIIDRYAQPCTPYLLPLISRLDGTEQRQYRQAAQNINRGLKQIAEQLHLKEPLTLYVARHTWASIAQSNHVPLSVISVAMGHDSETTTQIYLASIQGSAIDRVNSALINQLKR